MNREVDINKVLAAFDAEIGFRRAMQSLLEDKVDEVLITDGDNSDAQELYKSEIEFNRRGAKYLSNFRDYMYDLWKRGELS